LPEPSRGEGFGLFAAIPKTDFILRTVELGCHHSSRARRREATSKTYRLPRFKNLTLRSGMLMHDASAFFSSATALTVISSGVDRRFLLPLRSCEVEGPSKEKSLCSPSSRNYNTVPFGRAAAGDFAAGSGACSSTRRA
jgi:hypothetical protein